MRFDWWHPEYIAKCFIMVTIVEIHKLIHDFSKNNKNPVLSVI